MSARKRENKYEYEIHREPICECMECGNKHLRRHRKKKSLKKEEDRFLCIYLCPKCEAPNYLYEGDRETKRRVIIQDD